MGGSFNLFFLRVVTIGNCLYTHFLFQRCISTSCTIYNFDSPKSCILSDRDMATISIRDPITGKQCNQVPLVISLEAPKNLLSQVHVFCKPCAKIVIYKAARLPGGICTQRQRLTGHLMVSLVKSCTLPAEHRGTDLKSLILNNAEELTVQTVGIP